MSFPRISALFVTFLSLMFDATVLAGNGSHGNNMVDDACRVATWFVDSGVDLEDGEGFSVALGDLDGDGDLDAVVANWNQPNRVFINNPGDGTFSGTGQAFGNADDSSSSVALGDLDGDGNLDAIVTNYGEQSNVWKNDGSGNFTLLGSGLGIGWSNSVALGDLDGDGDLDAVLANGYEADRVWKNDGDGAFTEFGSGFGGYDPTDYSDEEFNASSSKSVALGDLDGDGYLDAMVANAVGNRTWLNDGTGFFTEFGSGIGNSDSFCVALGDLDRDGDLDAVFANEYQPSRVWKNDGTGRFTEFGSALGDSYSIGVALGDLDADGDLDVMLANFQNQPNTVWQNDGTGQFTKLELELGSSDSRSAALGDLDGDGDLDFMFTNSELQPNTVWENRADRRSNPLAGTFVDSGDELGNDSRSFSVALGDLDGDGDLDAMVANDGLNDGDPNTVWTNGGDGNFTDSGQELGNGLS
jgi:hypothetical protein